MDYSEKSIQQALWYYLIGRGHVLICPNILVKQGEVDLLTLTKTDMLWNIEIKISRSDFKADARKRRTWHIENNPDNIGFHKLFYAVPWELVQEHEVPDYAGLLWVKGKYDVKPIKAAKKLNEKPIKKVDLYKKMGRSIMYKYWKRMEKELKRDK